MSLEVIFLVKNKKRIRYNLYKKEKDSLTNKEKSD